VLSRQPLSGNTALVGNESLFCRSKKPRDQSFAEEFSDMGWVGGVVSSVRCRESLHLSGMKDDFVWAGSAGKRILCGIVLYFCRISVTIVNVAVQFLNDPLDW